MRILLTLPSSGFGGAELHDLTLCRRLKEEGHEIHVVFEPGEPTVRIGELAQRHGFACHHAPIAWRHTAFAADLENEQRAALAPVIDSVDPDVVLLGCPSPQSGIGPMQAINASGCPALCVFHLATADLVPTAAAVEAFAGAASAGSRFVAVSSHTAALIASYAGLPPGQVTVIENSVDLPDHELQVHGAALEGIRSSVRRELGLAPDERIILTVGRLDEQKGYQDQLDVVPEVVRLRPDAHFLWLGAGPLAAALRDGLRARGVSSYVSMLGHRDDVLRYMHAADVFLFPTHYEGLSLTLCEAILVGLPIVTTRSPGTESLFEHGANALLCPVGASRELARRVVELLDEPGLSRALTQGLKPLQARFRYARMLNAYRQALQGLHDQGTGRRAIDGSGNTCEEPRERPALVTLDAVPAAAATSWVARAAAVTATGAWAFSVSGNDLRAGLCRPGGDRGRLAAIAAILGDPSVGRMLAVPSNLAGPSRLLQDTRPETLAEVLFSAPALEPVPDDQPGISNRQAPGLAAVLAHRAGRRAIERGLRCRGREPAREWAVVFDSMAESGPDGMHWLDAAGLGLEAEDSHFVRELTATLLRRGWRDPLLQLAAALTPPIAGLQAARVDAERAADALSGGDAMRQWRRLMQGAGAAGPGRRALVAFHRVPFPVTMGSDVRAHGMLLLLSRLGYQCTLATYAKPGEVQAVTEQGARYFACHGIPVDVTPLSPAEAQSDVRSVAGVVNWDAYYFPSFHSRFVILADRLRPELVYVNYAQFGYLGAAMADGPFQRVLDTHDIVTVREAALARLEAALGQRSAMSAQEGTPTFSCEFLQYDGAVDLGHEAAIYDSQDVTIAISRRDRSVIAAAAPSTRAVYIPTVFDVQRRSGPVRRGDALSILFVGADNLLNTHAAAFICNVLAPRLCRLFPEFEFVIAGGACRNVADAPGIRKMGLVPNLAALYREASLVICPLFWASGQNVKVVEAMAWGLPVVTTPPVAERAHVVHRHNGMVAATPEEFLEAIKALGRDVALRRRLGVEAARTVGETFSAAAAGRALADALGSA